MNDKSLFWSIMVLVLFLFFCGIVASVDLFHGYHARMHCAYTWGRVVDVCNPSGKTSSAIIHYKVGDHTYKTHINPIDYRYLGDSVIVGYDTTRYQRGFVLLRNPRDSETAFFKSEAKILGKKWHNNLAKYQQQLAAKQESHRRREHFYDYLCRDRH